MRSALPLAAVLALGCVSYPEPTPGRGQLVVEISASPKEGIDETEAAARRRAMGMLESYADESSRDPDDPFRPVEYRRLPDIAVVLTGPNLPETGPAPTETRVTVGQHGFDRDLALLAPRGRTRLFLENRRRTPLTFFCRGESGDGFDVTVEPGAAVETTLHDPDLYDLFVEEDERLHTRLLVADSSHARIGRSGRTVFFDALPPGRYAVEAITPRLPPVRTEVEIAAGVRREIELDVSVNRLPAARR